MVVRLQSPSKAMYGTIHGQLLFALLSSCAAVLFFYFVAVRIRPLIAAAPDPRFSQHIARLRQTLRYWLMQWKQPRYLGAGLLHIGIFAGFLVLALRSIFLVLLGLGLVREAEPTVFAFYGLLKDYAATLVLLCVLIAIVRRTFVRPRRYQVPAHYGHSHTAEAVLILSLIALLMVADAFFEASSAAFASQSAVAYAAPAPFTLASVLTGLLAAISPTQLSRIHLGAYLIHELTFFSFLCLLPLGKHFHVLTSFFNVYFAKLSPNTLKPARWDVSEEKLGALNSIGVKKLEDFTWKQILDLYSCADCGRCSDQCPANAVGRPLSPRFFTLKGRDLVFRQYPLTGRAAKGSTLVGNIYSEDEIWSCTTCGACERECPLLLEHIDKIVDLRRGMVDEGCVPQSIQKPLEAIRKRGNPYGKPEKKRGEWMQGRQVAKAETLYFVDSATSYDARMQKIAMAVADVLDAVGVEFSVLGSAERDSGNEVRRFGEEMLFIELREKNLQAIAASGATQVVTADPHAYNVLKNDYRLPLPVSHISQSISRAIDKGVLRLRHAEDGKVYAFHDPCYLGRHNGVYDDPRRVLDAIPGLHRVEMQRSRDRSFCCGGGGLMLFYEPKEEQRMGVMRLKMAVEAGANVLVTACPFCLANIEDAIKVSGMEGAVEVQDLVEVVSSHLLRAETAVAETTTCSAAG